MRNVLILLAVAPRPRRPPSAAEPSRPRPRFRRCAKASLNLVEDGQLSIGTDNPAYPPWFGGGETKGPWKINDPSTGKGFESAVAYAVAKQLGFAAARSSGSTRRSTG